MLASCSSWKCVSKLREAHEQERFTQHVAQPRLGSYASSADAHGTVDEMNQDRQTKIGKNAKRRLLCEAATRDRDVHTTTP